MGSTIWSISKEEKEKLITTLTPELVVLRAKAGISQEELSDLIGVSRQTYSAIERGAKQMSWSTFLSLILFYDCNQKTHQVLRSIKAIPQEVMLAFNAGNTAKDVNLDLFLGDGTNAIIENLDEQAMRSIRTMIINGKKAKNKDIIKDRDFLSVSDYFFYFKNNKIWTQIRPEMKVNSLSFLDTPSKGEYPKFNRNTRIKTVSCRDDIEILDPPAAPQKPKNNLLTRLLPSMGIGEVQCVPFGACWGLDQNFQAQL